MKNNQMTFILVGLFFLLTLWTAVLGIRYNLSAREFREEDYRRKLQMNTLSFLNQLSVDVTEYSKRDSGINAVLQPYAVGNANPAAMLPPKTPAK
jgi:hypothetical protein